MRNNSPRAIRLEDSMESGKYTLHRRAMMTLQQLPEDEQAAVRERLATLGDVPSAGIKKIAADQPLYLLRINDNLRVILRAVAGQPPEILEVVRQETLESFAGTGG